MSIRRTLQVWALVAVIIVLAGVRFGLRVSERAVIKEPILEGSKASDRYIQEQEGVFSSHQAELVKQGRMPSDFGDAYRVLGQYGWHTGRDTSVREVGTRPSLGFLQFSDGGGTFGAYTFYEPAWEQAQRSWWIHGVMETGSNVLHAVNMSAKFTDQVVGYYVDFLWDGCRTCDGRTSPRHIKVLDIPKYSDGSLHSRELVIDYRAKRFVEMYNVGVLPADYVDMCACIVGGSTH